MVRMKKRGKVFIGCVLLLISYGVYTLINSIEFEEEVAIEELIVEMEIVNVDIDFLLWLNENYGEEFLVFYDCYLAGFEEVPWHECFGMSYLVLCDEYNGIEESIEVSGNTISFLGDVSFADNYDGGQAVDERGIGIEGVLSRDVLDYLFEQSLVIANAEFAVGEGGSPLEDKYYTFIGTSEKAALFQDMNVGLVTLANNHIYDYGGEVFSQTLEIYDDLGIETIGAGENIEEASQAAYYIVDGYKFAFVNANRSEKTILTPGATEDSAGVVRCYDPEYFISMIETEEEKADYVIAIVHWGTEYSEEIEDVMLETSHLYIDAGADAIVGHHAHVLQGIEYYDGKPIFYNLGNFLFNDKTLDTAIVTLEIEEDGSLEYIFLPCLQEDVFTNFVYDQDALDLIEKMNGWGINAYIDEQGNVLEKE
ncbi:CapA family protein [Tannockella kyphosi]|uniref:CapA family protein n=1 Tax=Tannockella kyphosi TaxID=2899121 RepID=UPI0020112DED|nr:CapA family protein [Tannockella kyphosi]